uniref:HPr family phosphocarrier protein n=1 Tax=Gallaecimonas sp. GXIMD4217 TaxID=3131927 RepID=UPI00404A3AB4
MRITAPHGLHVRPAAQLVALARTFEAEIAVCVGDQSANAKSLFCLQKLPLASGTEIALQANGSDAEQALEQLSALLESL